VDYDLHEAITSLLQNGSSLQQNSAKIRIEPVIFIVAFRSEIQTVGF
jgi:hypothetical protein